MPAIVLPRGTLRTSLDAPIRVELSCVSAERRKLRDWYDRLNGLSIPWLLLPATLTDSADGVTLEYTANTRKAIRLSTQIAEWNQNIAAAVPLVLGLARFMLGVATEFSRLRVQNAMICPGLVCIQPNDSDSWKLIALPIETATLADWSKASPEAWEWTSPEGLLFGRHIDPVYTLGAVLHMGFVGTLFPELLCEREKFSRLLRSRVGIPLRLEAVIRSATPARSRSDADALNKFVLDCIDAVPGRRPSEMQARSQFEVLEAKLTAERLSHSWYAENHPVVSDLLRRQYQKHPPKPEPLEHVPQSDKDWNDLAREHLDRRDVSTALSIAWNGIVVEGPHKINLYLIILQRAAAISPARAEIVSALNRLVQTYPASVIGESNLLRVAHIRMRYLAAQEVDVAPLLGASQTDWGRGAGLLLRAVFAIRRTGAYIETSKFCVEGEKVFAKMPQEGGVIGRYARAYLQLLDGIAHVGFVAGGGPSDYYADAMNRFGNALQLASEIGASELKRDAVHWLHWLGWLANMSAGKSAQMIGAGIQSILRLHGEPGPKHGGIVAPDVPGYDENYLFPT